MAGNSKISFELELKTQKAESEARAFKDRLARTYESGVSDKGHKFSSSSEEMNYLREKNRMGKSFNENDFKRRSELSKEIELYRKKVSELDRMEKKLRDIDRVMKSLSAEQQRAFKSGDMKIEGMSYDEYGGLRRGRETARQQGLESAGRLGKMETIEANKKAMKEAMQQIPGLGRMMGGSSIATMGSMALLAEAMYVHGKAKGYRDIVKGDYGFAYETGQLNPDRNNQYLGQGSIGFMNAQQTMRTGRQLWSVGLDQSLGSIMTGARRQGLNAEDWTNYNISMKKVMGDTFNERKLQTAIELGFNRSRVGGTLEDYLKTNSQLVNSLYMNKDMTERDMMALLGAQQAMGRAGYLPEKGASMIQAFQGTLEGDKDLQQVLMRQYLSSHPGDVVGALEYSKNLENKRGLLQSMGGEYATAYAMEGANIGTAKGARAAVFGKYQEPTVAEEEAYAKGAEARYGQKTLLRLQSDQMIDTAQTTSVGKWASEFTDGVVNAISGMDKLEVKQATIEVKNEVPGFGRDKGSLKPDDQNIAR